MQDQSIANASSSTGLVEITEESVNVQRSRPLQFDPLKHDVLNSEFKHLYTAITRARVNVWFFDEDMVHRAPVFEYFQRLGLVNVVAIGDRDAGSGDLVNMFAAKSTAEEWRKGGIRFYKHRLWVPAIQCFTFAGDTLMLQKSQAQQQAAEATKFHSTNRQQMRDEFLRAVESFLKCDMYDEAEICLYNAREWVLLAKLYQKTEKYQDAARLFKKKGLYKEASECYESQNNYAETIETFCHAGLFEEALSALERFNILSKSDEGRQEASSPAGRPAFQARENKEMEEVLQHLPSTTERIAFLKRRGCILEAARALGDDGRRDEAARLLRDTGRFDEAVKYSSDPKFSADCLISQVRTTRLETEDTREILQRALGKYQHCDDTNGQAEASLMLGKLTKDLQRLLEAGRLFDKCENCCGEVESVVELLETSSCTLPKNYRQWMFVRALERVLKVVTFLHKPAGELTMAERKEITKCEEHFGLFKTDVPHKKKYFSKCGGRFAKVDPEFVKSNASETEATIDTSEAHQKIGRFLVTFSFTLVAMIRKMLETSFSRNSVCRGVAGGTCDNADCVYQHKDSDEFYNTRFTALFNFVYLESVVERFLSEMTAFPDGREISAVLMFEDFKEFHSCQRFYNFFVSNVGLSKISCHNQTSSGHKVY
ncbi:TPR and ankyrin repeat-containing protein 1 [Desmophyllum pertusum]|uniref:TPR and ankyrin repeat-containing protein 1 n=1 Tax=Desmophyllum pertusum TaxID=174260 RepID=A0A9W9YYK9_9CNID|nr:TPR and ankyrin repeat-containing protein 1 [Desmophyllum pertusum]